MHVEGQGGGLTQIYSMPIQGLQFLRLLEDDGEEGCLLTLDIHPPRQRKLERVNP